MLAVGVAAGLYLGIFGLRYSTANPADVVSALYVFPIALLAMTFGRRLGLAAGLVAIALLCAWVAMNDVDLSVAGWVSRLTPLLGVGMVLGDAADKLSDAAEERRRHEIAVQRHRQAVEINDSLIQGMAAAKWSIEAGRTESGLGTLKETIRLGHELVSGLIRDADMGSVGRADLAEAKGQE